MRSAHVRERDIYRVKDDTSGEIKEAGNYISHLH